MERCVCFYQAECIVKVDVIVVYSVNFDTDCFALTRPGSMLFLLGDFYAVIVNEFYSIRSIGTKYFGSSTVAFECGVVSFAGP